jgi:hypothetical protein
MTASGLGCVKTQKPSNQKEDNSFIESQVYAGAQPKHQRSNNLLQTPMLLMKVRSFYTAKVHNPNASETLARQLSPASHIQRTRSNSYVP